MTTEEKEKLTPRQSEVLRHLRKGERPREIAKKLHTTGSNIHGHIRRIREAGVEVPGSSSNGSPAAGTSPARNHNGGAEFTIPAVAEPEDLARKALAQASGALSDRIETIDERARQLNEEMAKLGAERSELEKRSSRYADALDALG